MMKHGMIVALALAGAACMSSTGTRPASDGSSGGGGTSAGSGGSAAGGSGGPAIDAAAGGSGGGGTGAGGSSSGDGGSGGGGSGGSGAGGATGPACMDGTPTGTAPNTLTVNVDSAQNVVSKEIFGVLMERIGKDITGGLYVGTSSTIPNTSGMRNDIIQGFKDAGVGMIEWPGGCASNSYNWQPANPSNDVGTDRYMQLCAMLGIDPMIAGAGTSANAARNLAWVTYINNSTAHPEWNLTHFKIGNEVWGCGGNQTETDYEANYIANYSMLSPPINGKKLQLVASTGLIGNMTWLDTEVKNLGAMIDGIEVHDYIYHPDDVPCVGFTDAQYYDVVHRANKGQIGPRLDQIIAILDKYDSAKRIKIYEDEWGDWLDAFNNSADTWLQQITVMDAISTAEQLHLFMQHADRVFMAGMAQAINVIHSLFLTRASDAALVKTPAFYVFKMLIPHHSAGAKWAPNTLVTENVTGNGTSIPVLSAGTTVDSAGRVNVSLANVDLTNTRSLQITLNSSKSAYTVASAQVVTGPAKDSYNDYAQPEKVNIQPLPAASCTASGKSLRVTLPSKSVVMLVLTPQ